MGIDYVRKRVTIAFRNCFRAASRHPLLVFMACVLFPTCQLFPALFFLLVYASPVIASTLILLGTLLFYGHKNAPQIQKEPTSHHNEIHNLVFGGMGNNETDDETYIGNHKFRNSIKQEAKRELSYRRPVLVTRGGQFQPFGTGNIRSRSNDGSRRSSFDHPYSVLRHLEDDNKGWETGSSASASVTDMFPMFGEIHPLMQSDDDNDDDHYDHEPYMKDDGDHDDDDGEPDITWSRDHRNLMKLGTLEIERNQRLESLIARQKAIKNMRVMAEKNMVNIIDTHVSSARNTPFDLPNRIIPRRNSIDIPYDSRPGPTLQTNHTSGYRQRRSDIGIMGHTTLDPYPVPKWVRSETSSIGSTHNSGFNEHIIPRRRVSENDDIVKAHQAAKGDDRSNVVKRSGQKTDHEDKTSNKSSSSSFCDVSDDIHDDEEEEFGSVENSPTAKSKDVQELENIEDTDSDTDSESDTEADTEEAGLSQRLKSWFGWKA